MSKNKRILLSLKELIPDKINFVVDYLVRESIKVEGDFITYKLVGNQEFRVKLKHPISFTCLVNSRFPGSCPPPNYIEVLNKSGTTILGWNINNKLSIGDIITLR